MKPLVYAFIFLLLSICLGCGDSCATLVDAACEKHGEDSVTCIARARELEETSAGRERLCERALMLYRSMPESGQR